MQADLYNLVPAIGEVNGLRSNYSYAMIPGEVREFGACDIEIQNRKAEPRPEIRGDIARIYFYMEWAYPGHGILSVKNRKLFQVWDKVDPVDTLECERGKWIEQIQKKQQSLRKGSLQVNLFKDNVPRYRGIFSEEHFNFNIQFLCDCF